MPVPTNMANDYNNLNQNNIPRGEQKATGIFKVNLP